MAERAANNVSAQIRQCTGLLTEVVHSFNLGISAAISISGKLGLGIELATQVAGRPMIFMSSFSLSGTDIAMICRLGSELARVPKKMSVRKRPALDAVRIVRGLIKWCEVVA